MACAPHSEQRRIWRKSPHAYRRTRCARGTRGGPSRRAAISTGTRVQIARRARGCLQAARLACTARACGCGLSCTTATRVCAFLSCEGAVILPAPSAEAPGMHYAAHRRPGAGQRGRTRTQRGTRGAGVMWRGLRAASCYLPPWNSLVCNHIGYLGVAGF